MSNTLSSIPLRYDFSLVELDQRDEAIALTIEGRNFERTSLEAIVGFGKVALRMQSILPHGEFTKWLEAEFKLSTAMAYNFINVAKRFGDQIPILQELPITMTVLYQIAEPNAPKELTETVIAKAESGIKMSVKEVKELKQELKQTQEQAEEYESEINDLLDEKNELIDKIHELQKQLDIQRGIAEKGVGKATYTPPINKPKQEVYEDEFFEDEEDEYEEELEEEEEVTAKVNPVVDKQKELAELEKKLKDLRSADKELSKRIAEKEYKAALYNNLSPELKEKKIRLEQFKLKVVRLLTDSAEEELMLNTAGMDEDLFTWYEAIGNRCQRIADICKKMTEDYSKKINP